MLCSLLPESPPHACCALLRMEKSVPQHPVNAALVNVSGDRRQAKSKDSHPVKDSACITTTEGEGGQRNTLFGPVSLIPVGLSSKRR